MYLFIKRKKKMEEKIKTNNTNILLKNKRKREGSVICSPSRSKEIQDIQNKTFLTIKSAVNRELWQTLLPSVLIAIIYQYCFGYMYLVYNEEEATLEQVTLDPLQLKFNNGFLDCGLCLFPSTQLEKGKQLFYSFLRNFEPLQIVRDPVLRVNDFRPQTIEEINVFDLLPMTFDAKRQETSFSLMVLNKGQGFDPDEKKAFYPFQANKKWLRVCGLGCLAAYNYGFSGGHHDSWGCLVFESWFLSTKFNYTSFNRKDKEKQSECHKKCTRCKTSLVDTSTVSAPI